MKRKRRKMKRNMRKMKRKRWKMMMNRRKMRKNKRKKGSDRKGENVFECSCPQAPGYFLPCLIMKAHASGPRVSYSGTNTML